jgi:Mrp family chromosome partitioning ATPase
MTNFDSAFIKAYSKNEKTPAAVDSFRGASRREEPISDQLPNAGKAPSLSELVAGVAAPPRVRRIDTRPAATGQSGREVPIPPTSRPAEDHPHAPRIAPHTILDEDEVEPQPRLRKAPLSAFRRAEQRLARLHVESDSDPLPPAVAPLEMSVSEPEPANHSAWSFQPAVAARPQAAFQIEQFFWPEIVNSLVAQSKAGFELLCEQLIAGGRHERKLLGIAGSRAQAGATTVLLALASQLATRGVRVAIVDADIEHPELAHQLGILPQYTWQDVVQQSLAMGEDWVESTRDQVTLSGLLKPIRKLDARLAAGLREVIDQTREAFDLTLVDLGQLQRSIELGVLAAVRPEGVVIVSDARQRSRMSAGDLEQSLRAHGIDWWGIAENFNS